MEAKVDPTSGLTSIMQYCFPSTLFGGEPKYFDGFIVKQSIALLELEILQYSLLSLFCRHPYDRYNFV